jgi:transcriptional regulator GlxA family with amidase domain
MTLEGKKVAFLVAEGVEDLEYYAVAMRLQEEGIIILTAAKDLKPVKGKNGLEIKPDTKIEDLVADDLFGLVCRAVGLQIKCGDKKKPLIWLQNLTIRAKLLASFATAVYWRSQPKLLPEKRLSVPWGLKTTCLMPAPSGWMNLHFAMATRFGAEL